MKIGRKRLQRIPFMCNEMSLVFNHLYDNNFGVIVQSYNHSNLIMVMPDNFVPELTKEYDCSVSLTRGIFVYNERPYNLAVAKLKDEGSIIDIIDYKYKLPSRRKENKEMLDKAFENKPFASLLKNLR